MRVFGLALVGLALLALAFTGTAPAPDTALARLGPITLTATELAPGPGGTLTAGMQISTSGQVSDQLDAATAADGAPVGIYHEQVDLGVLPDLSGCGGETAPPAVVDTWLHYGPLPIPGQSGGASPPANATLTVQPDPALAAGTSLAITFYFANAGAVTLRLPVSQA
jgi:hypothetical protein